MRDMLPDILKQVVPQQYGFLKDLIDKSTIGAGAGATPCDAAALAVGVVATCVTSSLTLRELIGRVAIE